MRCKRFSFICIVLLIMALGVTACASKSKMDTGNSTAEDFDMTGTAEMPSATNSAQLEDANMSMTETGSEGETDSGDTGSTKSTNKVTTKNTNQKLIRTFTLDLETKDYTDLVDSVQNKVNELGGYIESSELSGNSYFNDNERTAKIIARVPKDKVDEFVNVVSKLGNVINKAESSKDVTLTYVDAESHKKSLEIEQERLLALLDKAQKLEDIITLEDRLSEVRYELESYASQLRSYDNQVDYSTVNLTISEVKVITPIKDKTAFDKMKNGLSRSLYDIKTGIVNVIVWIVVNLPYIIIWAVIIIVGLVIGKKVWKRNKKDVNPPEKPEE